MEGDIPEERVRAEILLLRRLHKGLADRKKYLVEFGHHAVVELEPACTLGRMDTLVVRKVYCDCLAAGIAVARIEYRVIYVQVRRRSRYECLVLRSAR